MKIGLLVECGRQGLEAVICPKIVALIEEGWDETIELEIIPMDNKKRLIQECGPVCESLLKDGCDRVVILWDERPAWPVKNEPLCWHNDSRDILAELGKVVPNAGRVYLVCIEREFESWLLFDSRMLKCVMDNPKIKRVSVPKRPDRIPDPKGAMTTLVKQLTGRRYIDVDYAPRFVKCLTDLKRLRKCGTFRRFEAKITGKPE